MDSFQNAFATNNFNYNGLFCVVLAYGLAELVFALLVYKYWLPRLNQPRPPPIIRGFEDPALRHKLFERSFRRQETLCNAFGVDLQRYYIQFVRNWFFVLSDDNENESSDGEPLTCIKESGLPHKDDIDKWFGWFYFNMDAKDMTEDWHQRELTIMYDMIKERHGMGPGPRCKQKLQPVQLTLEPLDIKHRPLALYLAFWFFQALFAAVLYAFGFSHHVSSTGLSYWYRPAKQQTGTDASTDGAPLPLLFFHGIAPAGATFYVPMLLWGLATDDKSNIDRPIFLFQNPAVTFNLTDYAPTEEETTQGAWEAVDKHCGPGAEVAVVGHSFGTCIGTYMIHSSQRYRVKQLVLIDPVSILLSDPDAITNFVYCRSHHRNTKLHDSVPEPSAAGWVMNELFVEHFLRRQFAWYNGELFLEEIPDTCKVLVCLSDRDEVLNAPKVRAHIDIFNGDTPILPRCMQYLKDEPASSSQGQGATTNPSILKGSGSYVNSSSSASLESAGRRRVEMIYWEGEGVGHGSCLSIPSTWQQIRRMMKKQEQQIHKEKAL